MALLSTSSKGLLEGDGEDQQDYGVGQQDPPDVIEHQVELDTSVVQQGLDEKMIGESELSSPESSLVETEDIPGDFERYDVGNPFFVNFLTRYGERTREVGRPKKWDEEEDGVEDQLAHLLDHEVLLADGLPPLLPLVLPHQVEQGEEDDQLPLARLQT